MIIDNTEQETLKKNLR